MGELADAKMIIPLDEMIAQAAYNSSDFHPAAWKGSAWNGRQFALPIQPTAELLLCRSDLLAEAGLTIPKTTDEVLEAARTLHCSKRGLSGIILNCGRGTPAAHTFMMTLADFGRPILDLPAVGDEFGIDRIEGEQFRPMIDTTEGRQASEYLLEIFRHAHAESIRCEWDRQFAVFSSGEAAMCYGWSVRAAAFERDEASPAHSKVAFVPHPPAPGCRAVSPIGGFSLGIPSGLEPANVSIAWKVMEYLTRPELLKWYVQKGSLTSPRFSTSADPEVQSSSAMIGAIDAMERRGTIQIWPRPPVPEFTEILSVLGSDIHEMLRGEVSVGQALSAAQNRIDTIMRANGRY
jgi:multiple sugar transport system substrate-binding protein